MTVSAPSHGAPPDPIGEGDAAARPLTLRPARRDEADALSVLVNSAYRGDPSRAGWTTEADLLGGQRTDPAALREFVATGETALDRVLFPADKVRLGPVTPATLHLPLGSPGPDATPAGTIDSAQCTFRDSEGVQGLALTSEVGEGITILGDWSLRIDAIDEITTPTGHYEGDLLVVDTLGRGYTYLRICFSVGETTNPPDAAP
jgi:hypothetical protein